MKLNLKRAFETILKMGKSSPKKGGDPPISMVLLLREPTFPTLDQLRQAGERAFAVSFAGGRESQYCVVEVVIFTLMKVGPHKLSFLNYTTPYGEGEFPAEFLSSLPHQSQKQAWTEHKAWMAVDYVKSGKDPELEYCVLATLCAELISTNCAGLWMLGERSLIPNDGNLLEGLRRIALSRDIGIKPDRAPN